MSQKGDPVHNPVITALLLLLLAGLFSLTSLDGLPTGLLNLDLKVNQNIGDEYRVITQHEWQGLADGVIYADGKTTYSQSLVFSDSGEDPIESCTVSFTKNNEGETGNFLRCPKGGDIFEYRLVFNTGLTSAIENNRLKHLENEKLMMLGQDFTITQARIVGDGVKLRMTGGPARVVIEEGKQETLVFDDQSYTIKVLTISDQENPKVILDINGQRSSPIEAKKIILLKNKIPLLIQDVMLNEAGEKNAMRDSITLIFGGGRSVTFHDSSYADNKFTKGGTMVNMEDITNSKINVFATKSGDEFTIHTISYRLGAAGKKSGDVYVAPGTGLTQFLRSPLGLLSSTWDITYNGLGGDSAATRSLSGASSRVASRGGNPITFDAYGKGYRLEFTNNNGMRYRTPLLAAKSGTLSYGDGSRDLVIKEGSSESDYNINEGDYFIVNSRSGGKGRTHIVQFEGIQNGKHAVFTDLAGSTKKVGIGPTGAMVSMFDDLFTNDKDDKLLVPLASITGNAVAGSGAKRGVLMLSGVSYNFFVNSDHDKIVVDQNADGTLDGSRAQINVAGNGILELGSAGGSANVVLRTPKRYLQNKTSDETTTITMTASGNAAGITLDRDTDYNKAKKTQEALTRYGTFFSLESKDLRNDLRILYPSSQQSANLGVTSGR